MYLVNIEKINNLRLERQLSKKRLGSLIGFSSQGSIHHLYKCGVARSHMRVLAICAALRCEPTDILIFPTLAEFENQCNRRRIL